MKSRRVTIATGLAVALLGAAAGSASAATLTPASWNFGKVPVEGQSAPKVFTLTKSSTEATYELEPEAIAITEAGHGTAHARFQGTNGGPTGADQCPTELTAAIPSCQIWVYFTPADPGRVTGRLFVNQYGCKFCSAPTPPLSAALSGTGTSGKKKCKKGKKRSAGSAKKKKCKKKKK
jgi:hypothetical protein